MFSGTKNKLKNQAIQKLNVYKEVTILSILFQSSFEDEGPWWSSHISWVCELWWNRYWKTATVLLTSHSLHWDRTKLLLVATVCSHIDIVVDHGSRKSHSCLHVHGWRNHTHKAHTRWNHCRHNHGRYDGEWLWYSSENMCMASTQITRMEVFCLQVLKTTVATGAIVYGHHHTLTVRAHPTCTKSKQRSFLQMLRRKLC